MGVIEKTVKISYIPVLELRTIIVIYAIKGITFHYSNMTLSF